jgi:glucokinase
MGWDGESGEDLARDYGAGVPIAMDAVRRSARAVGLGLVNAATLLDLEIAVIGGGFSFVADRYPDLVAATVREHAVNGYAADLKVVRAELGGDAPIIGAAALVHRGV